MTANHLLVCESYVCADFAETNDFDMSPADRLAKLNANGAFNRALAAWCMTPWMSQAEAIEFPLEDAAAA